jgi:hypothetical protein
MKKSCWSPRLDELESWDVVLHDDEALVTEIVYRQCNV